MKPAHLLLAIALAVPFAGALGWYAFPHATAAILLDAKAMSAGLSRRSIDTSLGPIGYLEGGEGETIVLVHGIFARKEHWIEMAQILVQTHHVIALDLPGFGDNRVLADDAYNLSEQARHLALVFEALELEHVHVGANSMGAYVTALFAARHPSVVASMTYIGSPLGVPSPVASDMETALGAGQIPLLARTQEQFDARNAWLSPNEIDVPSPVLETWRSAELVQASKNARIWRAVHDREGIPSLSELAPNLPMPSLIIWCKEDRIFHVSGAHELGDRLPDARVEIVKGCGHVPMIDRPQLMAQLYADFLASRANQRAANYVPNP